MSFLATLLIAGTVAVAHDATGTTVIDLRDEWAPHFGYPACVYGFFMFLVLAGTALVGLAVGRRRRLTDGHAPASLSPNMQAHRS